MGLVCVVVLVAVALTFVLERGSPKDPISAQGGALDSTFCFSPSTAVTSGADYLTNSGGSVTVTGATALATMNTKLVDTAVVGLTSNNAVGNGTGLPTANQEAGGAVPQDWAARQFVPHAVIQSAKHDPAIKAWQLVFGIKVLHPGDRATLQGVVLTFRAGGHTYHFTSEIHDVIEATGVPTSRC